MDNRLKLARPDLKEREEGRFFILNFIFYFI